MKTEFEFIKNLQEKFSLKKIGDDCAILPKDKQTDLVITTDLLVEDIDFRLEWTKPEFLGQKALAVSLSDVAAMGGKAVWTMLSIGIPQKIWQTDFVEKFYNAYFRFARKFNVEIIGGDVSRTPDKVVFDSIVAGEVKKGQAVLRSGAKVGDSIFVTGSLGGAAAGLKLLEEGIRYGESRVWQSRLLEKQLMPFPQNRVGRFLGENQIASAMIDLSDGVSSDLAHICRKNQVGARIFADRIPFHKNLRLMTDSFEEKLNYALNGGEDFELLFTVDPKKIFHIQNKLENGSFFHIGEITAKAEIIELISHDKIEILQPKGFRHF